MPPFTEVIALQHMPCRSAEGKDVRGVKQRYEQALKENTLQKILAKCAELLNTNKYSANAGLSISEASILFTSHSRFARSEGSF